MPDRLRISWVVSRATVRRSPCRTTRRASKTIKTFPQHTKQQWLVAVNMVSEGVDIPRLRVGVYATNVLTEMYFRQVVGRFVRMQEGVPKPQRAWLYLPKDATFVHYAKHIKAERDHVLEDIMPSVQRTLFGTAATSLKEYMPLHGVARMDALIGGEETESDGVGMGVAEPSCRSMTKRPNCEISIGRSSAPCHERPESIIVISMPNSSSEPEGESIRRLSRSCCDASRC